MLNWLKQKFIWLKENIKKVLVALGVIGTVAAASYLLPPETTRYYYLAPWEWRTGTGEDHWHCPDGDCLGLIDLRSIPQMSKAGGVPEGFGFFVYDKKKTIKNSILLGNNLEDIYNGKTVLDFLWDKLTVEADPTGLATAKPLMPGQDLNLKLYLGGHSLVKSEKFDKDKHPFVLEVIKNDYRRIRQEDIKRGSQNYKRALDALSQKYKIDYHNFLPADLPDEGKLPHSTTFTEDWNCADSGSLTCDQTWTEYANSSLQIVSNAASIRGSAGASTFARADLDLSTDDHYAQFTITAITENGGNQRISVFIRKDSSTTNTNYRGWGSLNDNLFRINKVSGGAFTNLFTDYAVSPALNDVLYLEADGSALDLKVNSVSRISGTDTSITANLRTGIHGQSDTSAGNIIDVDNFQAGDLAAAVSNPPIQILGPIKVY